MTKNAYSGHFSCLQNAAFHCRFLVVGQVMNDIVSLATCCPVSGGYPSFLNFGSVP